ncbi:MAG: hypothetical protein RL308_3312, partial [Bacteroidota bacterium]
MSKLIRFKIILSIIVIVASNCSIAQFSPSDLPSLKLWLKSDNVILNGLNVSQWNDASGNNFNLTQSNIAKQPIQSLNALNGYPSVRFDGVNDNLKSLFGQNFTGPFTIIILMNSTSSNPVFIYDGGTSYLSMIYLNNNLYIQSGAPNISYAKTAPFSYRFFQNQYNNTQSKIFENGIQKLVGSLPAANLDGFTLGTRYQQDTFFFKGDIIEVIIYNSILGIQDKIDIESYLLNKYVSQFSLGQDTTTSNFCPINLTAPAGFTNLLWSTGATTPTISATQGGQ